MPTIGGIYVPEPERPGLGAILGAATERTIGELRYGLPYQARKLIDDPISAADEQRYLQGLAEAGAAGARAQAASLDDATSGRVGVGRFIAENLVASLPSMVGTVAGAVGGAVVGGPGGAIAGGIAGGTPMFSASNVARAVNEEGTLSSDAATRSLLTAPLQSAADAAITRFLPGAGKVFGDLAASQSGGFIRRTAASMAKAAGTEAVTEAAQQVGERYAAGLQLTDADAAAEYVNAAVTAFAVGGVMGAGGGFRRSNAIAKPADTVTLDDMNAHVDSVLDGSARPLGPQLDLGLTGGTAAEFQPALPMQPDEGVETPASRLPQLPGLFPALSSFVPDTQLELGQTVEDNLTPVDLPGIGGLQISGELEAMLQGLGRPAPQAPLGSQPSTLAMTGLPGGEPSSVELPARRVFADTSLEELETAVKAKDAPAEVVSEARRELAARRNEATGAEPLTTDNFQQRVDELKSGLRGGWVQKLEASDPADLTSKVFSRLFVDNDTAMNVQRLGQRVGLLDDDFNPTETAQRMEAERDAALQAEARAVPPAAPAPTIDVTPAAPAAPASPEFAAEWKGILSDAGVQRMRGGQGLLSTTPSDLAAARSQVFRALADDASNAEVSQVEKVARKMGLITDDDAMDVTPLGRQAFLSTPEGFEETIAAAQQQGYTGREASVFDRGVKAQLSGETQTPFTDFGDLETYEAGKVWAQDFIATATTKTAAQTAAIQSRQGSRATGQAVDRKDVRTQLTPAQVRQQAANNLISAVDLRGVSDSDVSALRRMARDGASAADIGRTIEGLQKGKTTFRETARSTTTLSPLPVRGQPRFKEINTPDAGPAKATQRVESEAAVQTFELRNLVDFAQREGGISAARAAKLHDLLDQGKVGQVRTALKAFDPDAAPRTRLPTPPERAFERSPKDALLGAADTAFEQLVDGKTFAEAVDQMVANAPSKFHREIMRKVGDLAKQMTKQGYAFELNVVKPGDSVPATLARLSTRGLAQVVNNPPKATVWLKNSEFGPETGMNYQIAAHEMLHAVTVGLLDYGNTKGVSGKGKLGKAVTDLYELQRAIANHFNTRSAEGNLSDFEQRYFKRGNNSLANVDEIIAWGLTNPDMQRYLQSIEYKPKQSVFGRLVELLRNLLGLEGKYDTALTELLRVSEQVLGTRGAELTASIARNDPDAFDTVIAEAPASEAAADAANRTAEASNDVVRTTMAAAAGALERVNIRDMGVKARRTALGAISHNQLERAYADQVPTIADHRVAHQERTAVRSRFEQIGTDAYQRFEALEQANKNAAKWVGELMALEAEFQLDHTKTWAEHIWHKDSPNAADLKRLHGDAVKRANDLKRGDGAGMGVYQTFRDLNEAENLARMSVKLHNLVTLDRELALGVEGSMDNPADKFMRESATNDATSIREYWRAALNQQMAAMQDFVDEKTGEADRGTDADRRAMRERLLPINDEIADIFEARKAMDRAPYFHLGRFGDNFGSAMIRTGEDGNIDPQARQQVAEALENAGFGVAQMSADNTKPRFMLRFDTVDQAVKFRELMLDLQRRGLLSDAPIKVGPREQADNFGTADALPTSIQRYIRAIEASPQFAIDPNMSAQDQVAITRAKDAAVQAVRDEWIASQPDSSISKVLTRRYTVPGYSKDMVRNWAHRWRVGSVSIANASAAPKFNRVFEAMRAQYQDELVANRTDAAGNAVTPGDPFLVQDIYHELRRRDAQTPVDETADTLDKARAVAHSYFLGFSPAYGLINMTQLGVVALPELAKQHGYSKSFHAMRRASGDALKIVKAVASEAGKLGWRKWGDVAITDEVLTKAGLSPQTREFLTHMLATGTIDIGSMARSLGQVADDKGVSGGLETYLKLSSAIGLYTETFSRLVTALAAQDLHGGTGKAAQDYASKVVSEAMLDYQSWNTARYLGKKGLLGPVTPLVTQFMSYQVQITEKLYAEAMNAFGKARPGESAETAKQRRTEARRFLMGHLAAVTTLAGTLGLPFATVFATVFERLVDAADGDDEPFDATASWRNFLSSVFGQQMGEVISRGAPRALGFDISARAGEQNLLPFSELLADRRSWKEAIANTAGRSIGATPSMLVNIMDGGNQIADGDILAGMKTMLPIAYKGPLEAYRMTTEGYVDTKGNKLPLTPGAADKLWQFLGFAPAEKAEYGEARGDLAARRGVVSRDAAQLRQGIVRAMLQGDNETARQLVTDAIQFDNDNPAFAVLPGLAGTLERQIQARGRAAALRTPTGVSVNDLAGQQLTGYANVEYR